MNPPPNAAAPEATAIHPLEPLSGAEIAAAAEIVRRERGLGAEARFVFITLREPLKEAVRAWTPGAAIDREARIVLRDLTTKRTCEALVSLTADALLEFEVLDGVQAPVVAEEFMAAEEAVRSNPEWQAAMRRRGVEDFDLCMLDPWSASYQGPEDHPSQRRIIRPLTWVRDQPGGNGYARPADNLVVTLDLDTMAVVSVEDHGVIPFPELTGNYEPELLLGAEGNVPQVSALREDLAPIEITQPQGDSITKDGHHIQWQKWDLRISFNPREGLVLHQIGYHDGGELRPIIYRASLSEMWVPYADPSPTQGFKNVFDMGEYGLGWLANSLELGCDCLGEITYFDGTVHDQDGQPVIVKNAICMHEEDFGIGWKHTDFRTEAVEVRRLRRLVISMIATVGNYEYGYFWYLYTDGTIEYEVKLTGILTTAAYDPAGPDPEYGCKLAPGLYGPHHQHFFCVRLDMEVDGASNRVSEVNSNPVPIGPENPTGNIWKVEKMLLATEQQAQRSVDPSTGRFWKIESSERTNRVGDPTSYKIEPGATAFPMMQREGLFGTRGQFAFNTLWVTPWAEREQYAAGEYPNQHPGGQGLPAWTAADRSVADTDLVVWYSFAAHHVVRPEDWPVMPTHHIGFKLKPAGFFDGNPALDMPRSTPAHGAACCSHGEH